jgi:hypothetical protein
MMQISVVETSKLRIMTYQIKTVLIDGHFSFSIIPAQLFAC